VGRVPEGSAFWLLLAGVAINAAVPPLHAWLTDAYPEASVTGSVFLSAFTTKTAVYVLVRAFPGPRPSPGRAPRWRSTASSSPSSRTTSGGSSATTSSARWATWSRRRHGDALALDGATAHAFCHILYKALLFMGAGAVLQVTGRRRLTELGGIGGG
jgi:multicomponent Na+:H+ antiporter subunit D